MKSIALGILFFMEDIKIKKFNLRVYGLLFKNDSVLVTDEHRGGVPMTKFPGGGIEKGEGITDALIREFMEEISISVNVEQFFYVNDFLQISQFNPTEQLVSFYYEVKTKETVLIPIEKVKKELKPNEQVFRWVKISDLEIDSFTFPVDRVVVKKIIDSAELYF